MAPPAQRWEETVGYSSSLRSEAEDAISDYNETAGSSLYSCKPDPTSFESETKAGAIYWLGCCALDRSARRLIRPSIRRSRRLSFPLSLRSRANRRSETRIWTRGAALRC
jgi:hypothetical protein